MRFGWIGKSAVILAAVLGFAETAPADAATSARFGSVDVACDDDLTCVAAIASRAADGSVTSVLQVGRIPTSRSRWTIAFSTLAHLADRDRPVSVAVDGGVGITLRPGADFAPFVDAGTFYILSSYGLDRLMVDLQLGYEARISYIDIAGGAHTDRYPLDGFTAALAEIDRVQRRIGRDRRAGPPEDLPPAPEVDTDLLIALEGVPPRLLEWHLASSNCEAPDTSSLAGVDTVIAPLSDTAMLYAIPCFVRGGRPNHRLYMIESGEIGGMHTLLFATYSTRFGWTGADVLEDIAYDPGTRRLTATESGGLDACAAAGVWTFDALAFRLDEMRAPESCTAPGGDPADWPVVYQR
ncbi:MAG TPA: DUF1176 domain-containing protein [Methylomirabilota bacterium]|nr:DUF1176 domain-containing protein [Methylomirabilota bacterium]